MKRFEKTVKTKKGQRTWRVIHELVEGPEPGAKKAARAARKAAREEKKAVREASKNASPEKPSDRTRSEKKTAAGGKARAKQDSGQLGMF